MTELTYIGKVRDQAKLADLLESCEQDLAYYRQLKPCQNMSLIDEQTLYFIYKISRKKTLMIELKFSEQIDYSDDLLDTQWVSSLLSSFQNE